jgi:hypothetical protein
VSAQPRPRDNRDRVVQVAIAGRLAPARLHAEVPPIDREGRWCVLPGTGGITHGVHVGDPVDERAADHLMVGASMEDAETTPPVPGAFHLLACLGNRVRDGRGATLGVVAGKRGGLAPGFFPPNLVSVEAPDDRLATLLPGDRVVGEARGRGLAFTDLPDVTLSNLDPRLLDGLPLGLDRGRIVMPVRATVPTNAAGPGLGQDGWVGDLEIGDPAAIDDGLRFGDLVAFADLDGRVSRFYRPDHVAVGLVVHGPSPRPGHGVGVTILLSGPTASLVVRLDAGATVGPLLRTWGAER